MKNKDYPTRRQFLKAATLAISAPMLLPSGLWANSRKPTPEELEGWPIDLKGHVPIAPGEHPRLFFRKTDLEKLRVRAKTPEGQAMLKRLRVQLNGSDGESLPEKFAGKGPRTQDRGGGVAEAAAGSVFTYSHPAGYGLGLNERNPGEVLPHAFRDTHWKFDAWRNRWQDKDDVIISILTRASKGNMGARGENTLTIQTGGKTAKWGRINGFTEEFAPKPDGSTVMLCGGGASLAIDFSKASGADALLVQTGVLPGSAILEAGGNTYSLLFPAKGEIPTPKVQDDKVAVGGQTVSFDGKKIVLAK